MTANIGAGLEKRKIGFEEGVFECKRRKIEADKLKDLTEKFFEVIKKNVGGTSIIFSKNIDDIFLEFHTLLIKQGLSYEELDGVCKRLHLEMDGKTETQVAKELSLVLLRDGVFDIFFGSRYLGNDLSKEGRDQLFERAVLLAKLDPESCSANGSSLMVVSIAFGDFETYKKLRELGVGYNQRNHFGESAYDELLKCGDLEFIKAVFKYECHFEKLREDFIECLPAITCIDRDCSFERYCLVEFVLAIKNKDIKAFWKAYESVDSVDWSLCGELFKDYLDGKKGSAIWEKVKKDLAREFCKNGETLWMFFCTIEPKLFSIPYSLEYPFRYHGYMSTRSKKSYILIEPFKPIVFLKNEDFAFIFLNCLFSQGGIGALFEVVEKLNSLVLEGGEGKLRCIDYDSLFTICVEDVGEGKGKELFNNFIEQDAGRVWQLILNLSGIWSTEQLLSFLGKTINFTFFSNLGQVSVVIGALIEGLSKLGIGIKDIQECVVGIIEARDKKGYTILKYKDYRGKLNDIFCVMVHVLLEAKEKKQVNEDGVEEQQPRFSIQEIQEFMVGVMSAKDKDDRVIIHYKDYQLQFSNMITSIIAILLSARETANEDGARKPRFGIQEIHEFVLGVIGVKDEKARTIVEYDSYLELVPGMLEAIISILLSEKVDVDGENNPRFGIQEIQEFVVGVIGVKDEGGFTALWCYSDKVLAGVISALVKPELKVSIAGIQEFILRIMDVECRNGGTMLQDKKYDSKLPDMIEKIISMLLKSKLVVKLDDIRDLIIGIIHRWSVEDCMMSNYGEYSNLFSDLFKRIISVLLSEGLNIEVQIGGVQSFIVELIEAKGKENWTIMDRLDYQYAFSSIIEGVISVLAKFAATAQFGIEDIRKFIVGIIEAKGRLGNRMVNSPIYLEQLPGMLKKIIVTLVNSELKVSVKGIQEFVVEVLEAADWSGSDLMKNKKYRKQFVGMLREMIVTLVNSKLKVSIKEVQGFVTGILAINVNYCHDFWSYTEYCGMLVEMLREIVSAVIYSKLKPGAKEIQEVIVGILEIKGDDWAIVNYGVYRQRFADIVKGIILFLFELDRFNIKEIQAMIVGVIKARGENGKTIVDSDYYAAIVPDLMKVVITVLSELKCELGIIIEFVLAILEASGKGDKIVIEAGNLKLEDLFGALNKMRDEKIITVEESKEIEVRIRSFVENRLKFRKNLLENLPEVFSNGVGGVIFCCFVAYLMAVYYYLARKP